VDVSREQKWPDVLWIVRHGESAGNVARDAAMEAGLAVIDIPLRDVDVPLSTLGERQASALAVCRRERTDGAHDRGVAVWVGRPGRGHA